MKKFFIKFVVRVCEDDENEKVKIDLGGEFLKLNEELLKIECEFEMF